MRAVLANSNYKFIEADGAATFLPRSANQPSMLAKNLLRATRLSPPVPLSKSKYCVSILNTRRGVARPARSSLSIPKPD